MIMQNALLCLSWGYHSQQFIKICKDFQSSQGISAVFGDRKHCSSNDNKVMRSFMSAWPRCKYICKMLIYDFFRPCFCSSSYVFIKHRSDLLWCAMYFYKLKYSISDFSESHLGIFSTPEKGVRFSLIILCFFKIWWIFESHLEKK